MKLAFIRFNDVVYASVPYIENYGYVDFAFNSDNRIVDIMVQDADQSCRELIVTDREITLCEKDCVPQLCDVEFLSPSEESRFSLKLFLENGERKRYDFAWDFGDNEVVSIGGLTFTDNIFRNGRITKHLPLPSWIQVILACSTLRLRL